MPLAMRAVVLCLVVDLAACPFVRTPPGLSAAQRAEIVGAHNAWRARVGTTPLVWSVELADRARRWAETLAGSGCGLQVSRGDAVGENLYWAGPVLRDTGRRAEPITPAAVVDAWASEATDYSYGRNACARGKTCGHYTQIVWGSTREVGCATATCPDEGVVWVCNYWPAGNVRGQRPY